MAVHDGVLVQVENFGPIGSGSIDLRPLTVLTGPSNTGKSWFATLFYTLYNRRFNIPIGTFRHNLHVRQNSDKSNSLKLIEDPEKWIQTLKSEKRITLDDQQLTAFEHFLSKDNNRLEMELCKSFGFTNRNKLIRSKSRKGANIQISLSNPNRLQKNLNVSLSLNKASSKYSVSLPKEIALNKQRDFFHDLLIRQLSDPDRDPYEVTSAIIARLILRFVNESLFGLGGALYIPAGRVGLMDSFRSIVSSSIQSEGEDIHLKQLTRPLSGVLVDFLQNLINISPVKRQNLHNAVATQIEKRILEGKIEVDFNQLNFPYFSFFANNMTEKIPLNVTSSMVSQLAPVVLFLRYSNVRNRVLILEEPEVHLHPRKQVELVDEIAKLVKNGYKILLTTHSEFIIAALSNHVIMAENKDEGLLHPRNVGFWRFDKRNENQGTVVEEVQWDLDDGGYDHRFDRVNIEMLNVWLKEREKTECGI